MDDEYDDDETTWDICVGDDCRAPRAGPFVTLHETGATLCYRCFISDELRIDPEEYGLV